MRKGRSPRIALTGATGFIGDFLIGWLQKHGYYVRVLARDNARTIPARNQVLIGNLESPKNLDKAMEDMDYVVHCAGLAHNADILDEHPYQVINNEGTQWLARAAARNGIKRFVFMSSVRALCGPTSRRIVSDRSPFRPTDAYGRSKRDAENYLMEQYHLSEMDWVALRPVLTYGPNVKGNMAKLIRLAKSPFPLPLAGLEGVRSVLSLENLGEAVLHVLEMKGPIKRSFLVADEDDLTVPEMIAALRHGMNRRPSLFSVSQNFLASVSRIAGMADSFERLSENLIVDTRDLRKTGWKPLHSAEEGLESLGEHLLASA